MALVNSAAIAQLESALLKQKALRRQRALEVACGECHVTRDLLQRHFDKIDLLDQCPKAIEYARALEQESGHVGDIYH